jgi:predicted MPP superfamily phosphohydrolase
MLPSEIIRVFAFGFLVVAVYVATGAITVRWIGRRLGPDARLASRREIGLGRVIFGLAGLRLACMAYGYFVEPYWLEVSHARIESSKLQKGTRPIRIVQISDVHSDPAPRLEERLPALVAAEKPDLIVFTGDALNSAEALPVFQRCLRALAKTAPTFGVRGNWDMDRWRALDLFGDTGARELNGDAAEVKAAGTDIWIAGVAWAQTDHIDRALGEVPAGAFTIFLYHSPDQIFALPPGKVDLYLAGHTHGGQVALPLYGALTTASKFGKRFEAGLYRVQETWLYVNRGIGMEGDAAPRVRFCARPEVTVIEVRPLP